MEYSEYLKLKTWVNLVLCEFDFDGNYLEVISKLMFVVPAWEAQKFRLKAVRQTLLNGFEMPSIYLHIEELFDEALNIDKIDSSILVNVGFDLEAVVDDQLNERPDVQ